MRAQRQTLEEKRQLLDQAIGAIGEVEAVLRAGNDADAALYRRIIEVIEMQNNPDAWKQKYRRPAANEDRAPALALPRGTSRTPRAVDRAGRRNPVGPGRRSGKPTGARTGDTLDGLLEKLMGKPVGSDELGRHQSSQEWNPQMATFVDKPVWDFMTQVPPGKL